MSTKIEWCDETLNPMGWGRYGPGGTPESPKACSYCYARRLATRSLRDCELCRQFIPHWHPEQAEKPMHWKKGRKIFWQSMGDLFHPWTPWEQIHEVRKVVNFTPQHIHIFLTKNPKRLQEFNPWPSNCWVGTTVKNQADADERLSWLLQVEAAVRFVSHEPLLGAIDATPWTGGCVCDGCGKEMGCGEKDHAVLGHIEDRFPELCGYVVERPRIDWAIIGSMTGPGAVKSKPEWVQNLIDQYRVAGVPVFLKDNLKWTDRIQEFPK